MQLTEQLKEEILSILKNLVQIPTENPPGITKNIVEYLVLNVFKEEDSYQNQIVTQDKDGVMLHNLVSKLGQGKDVIVLSGHFDVIPIGDENQWKYPPFSAEVNDGLLYGRGSADMKGGIAFLIGLIKILSNIPKFLEKYTIMFLGTADEENGMVGSSTLANQGYMKDAILLIVAEPTNLKIGIGEKGLIWVKLKTTGKAAHGSMPEEGINAIEKVMKLIPHLYEVLEEKQNSILGKSTLNIGKIVGGTAINIVPEQVTIDLDYRLIPEQNQTKLLQNLKNLQKDGLTIDLKILKQLPALFTDPNHFFVQNLHNISKQDIIGLPYGTDAAYLANREIIDSKIPFVIYGPGNPANIHKANEFIEIEQIFEAIEHMTNAILQSYFPEGIKP
jgi:succinyl-diaminopimelate desuccinylase